MSADFTTTRWTLVRQATGHSPEGQAALSDLCATYYEPVVSFLRRSGRPDDAAREATHAFFADLLAKPALGGAEPGRGKFRSYLLGALKHHLAHATERESRQKRGGGLQVVSIDAAGSERADTSSGLEVPDLRLPPDREFDRHWAQHVVQRALAAVAAEWPPDEFQVLRPFLSGEAAHGDLAALAASRGENPDSLRKTLSRLRQSFRQCVKAEVTPTLDNGTSVDEEMQALLEALS
jgi:DNA-directed RNA polymerase specialized sigma24 family protein